MKTASLVLLTLTLATPVISLASEETAFPITLTCPSVLAASPDLVIGIDPIHQKVLLTTEGLLNLDVSSSLGVYDFSDFDFSTKSHGMYGASTTKLDAKQTIFFRLTNKKQFL